MSESRVFSHPFADTSLIPTFAISRAIRQAGIICALSGDGGDEGYGGYAAFWRIHRLKQLMDMPAPVQGMLHMVAQSMIPFTHDLGRQLVKALQLARHGQRDIAAILSGLANYLTEDQKEALVLPTARKDLDPARRLFGPAEAFTTTERLSARLTETFFDIGLVSDMLRKVDVMSMRASIELRVPFLDETVVANALTLAHSHKTDGAQGKLVLRSIAQQVLPPQVSAHHKQGFSIPIDVMVDATFYTLLEDYLLGADARVMTILDRRVVTQWIARFKEGPATRGGAISRGGLYQRIIMILALEIWLRKYNLSW